MDSRYLSVAGIRFLELPTSAAEFGFPCGWPTGKRGHAESRTTTDFHVHQCWGAVWVGRSLYSEVVGVLVSWEAKVSMTFVASRKADATFDPIRRVRVIHRRSRW